MQIEINIFDTERAELACEDCQETLFHTRDQIIDPERLIGILQVHMYACPRRKMPSRFKCPYHPNQDLWYYQENTCVLRCTACNRIIPQAEIQLASRRRTR